MEQGRFRSLFSCNFEDQMSPNIHRVVILCTCWDTSENTGLRQLPIILCQVPLKTFVMKSKSSPSVLEEY